VSDVVFKCHSTENKFLFYKFHKGGTEKANSVIRQQISEVCIDMRDKIQAVCDSQLLLLLLVLVIAIGIYHFNALKTLKASK
jgi:hypothetical protein